MRILIADQIFKYIDQFFLKYIKGFLFSKVYEIIIYQFITKVASSKDAPLADL